MYGAAMKTFGICAGIAVFLLVAVGAQFGLFSTGSSDTEDTTEAVVEEKPATAATPRAKFPDDLAPAGQARPVPPAAEFKAGPDAHKVIFLRPNGVVHPWNENVREDWQAERVEETELAVVVGTPKKYFVDRTDYPGGAPPISRYIYDVEVSVVEAKTGKILANRFFKNVPRGIMKVETWDTTAIGKAVSVQQVFGWVSRHAKYGFPETHDSAPIVTTVD